MIGLGSFYCSFYSIDDIPDSKTLTEENLQLELIQTFSPELALAAYIPLTSIFGRYIHFIHEHLMTQTIIIRGGDIVFDVDPVPMLALASYL